MTHAQRETERDGTRDWFSPVGDSVLAAMRRRGVVSSDLADDLPDGARQLRDLLAGEGDIDDVTAQVLSARLGGSPAFWLARQREFDRALDHSLAAVDADERAVWLERIPMPSRPGRGPLGERRARAELSRRLRFYGVSSLTAWHSRYGGDRAATRFRSTASFTSDEGAVSMWLRQGEVEAALVDTAKWDPEILRGLLPEIRALSRFSRPGVFVPRLRALLARAGVALVFVRAPKGCRASGASRMVAADKAMVLVSFRHRSDDQFWFTLLHETGHLLLHGAATFVDTDDQETDRFEEEANAFAEELIVPPDRVAEMESLANDRKAVVAFARDIGVCPGLVMGQLQHRGLRPFIRSSRLQRTWTLQEIEAAFVS